MPKTKRWKYGMNETKIQIWTKRKKVQNLRSYLGCSPYQPTQDLCFRSYLPILFVVKKKRWIKKTFFSFELFNICFHKKLNGNLEFSQIIWPIRLFRRKKRWLIKLWKFGFRFFVKICGEQLIWKSKSNRPTRYISIFCSLHLYFFGKKRHRKKKLLFSLFYHVNYIFSITN